ncbi:DUF2628 domain-containing protein [Vibrio sp. PP-XX7]
MRKTTVTEQTIDIETLSISEKWKRRFKLFDALNAGELSRHEFIQTDVFKRLGWKDRACISSNLWAFLGGFIYYFCKGMHYKGFIVLSLSLLWSTLLSMFDFLTGIVVPDSVYWVVPGACCSMFASLDYYQKTIHGEVMWRTWPQRFTRKPLLYRTVLISLLIYGGAIVFMGDHEYSTNAAQGAKRRFAWCVASTMFTPYRKSSICLAKKPCVIKFSLSHQNKLTNVWCRVINGGNEIALVV